MRSLIVYTSMRGSTARIAVAVAAGPTDAGEPDPEAVDAPVQVLAPRRRAGAFDTRSERARHLPASVAGRAGSALCHRGHVLVDLPASFYVTDLPGHLVTGEKHRVRGWCRRLAATAGGAPGVVACRVESGCGNACLADRR